MNNQNILTPETLPAGRISKLLELKPISSAVMTTDIFGSKLLKVLNKEGYRPGIYLETR